MTAFRITEDAKEDLLGIRQYTLENWGTDQSRKYLENISQKLLVLSKNPLLGIAREDFGENIYSFPHGSHLMYYTIAQDQLVLFAVLHTSMVPLKHLEGRSKE